MFPRSSLLYLTNACYLNCRHCGIVKNESPEFLSEKNVEIVLRLLRAKKCYIVAISGGDPIIHPKCFEIISKIRENGMLPVLGVSGVKLDINTIRKIKMSQVGCVQVSIDGTTETENALFRDKGSFQEIVYNIKRMKNEGIRVNVAVCFSKENVQILESMLKFLKELEVYQIKIQFWKKTCRNNNFNELDYSDKRNVLYKLKGFVLKHGLYNWANIDTDFLKIKDKTKKFILYPNGYVYSKENGKCIGKLEKDYERILRYYE